MKIPKIFIRVIFLFSFLSVMLSNLSAMTWEVGFKVMDSQGYAMSILVTVYTLNPSTRNLDVYSRGYTTTSFSGFGDTQTNGAFDIGDNTTTNAILGPLAAGGTYYIRIDGKYYIITYSGSGAYGDMKFQYQNGMSLLWNNSGYNVSGPYTWTDKTITLANDFVSDRTSCYGNIYLNSVTLPNVGYGGTSQTRESGTFPHTISGEDNQYVNYFYRKWRNWRQDGDVNISKTLPTPQPYSYTAVYAKQVTATVNKNYSGGYITVNGIVANPTGYMYDDLQNNSVSSSPQGYTDGLYYELRFGPTTAQTITVIRCR